MRREDLLLGLVGAFGIGLVVGAALIRPWPPGEPPAPAPSGPFDWLIPPAARLDLARRAMALPLQPIAAAPPSPPSPPALPPRAEGAAALPFDWTPDSEPRDLWGPATVR